MKQIFFRRDTWIVATWANKKKEPTSSQSNYISRLLKKVNFTQGIYLFNLMSMKSGKYFFFLLDFINLANED